MATELSANWQQQLDSAKAACSNYQFDVAEHALQQALECAHDQGAPDKSVAEIFHYIGWCSHAQQKFVESKRAYGQALATYERACGAMSPEAAVVVQSIGRLLIDAGKPEQARPMYERAYMIFCRTYGPDHDVCKALQADLNSLPAPPPEPMVAPAQSEPVVQPVMQPEPSQAVEPVVEKRSTLEACAPGTERSTLETSAPVQATAPARDCPPAPPAPDTVAPLISSGNLQKSTMNVMFEEPLHRQHQDDEAEPRPAPKRRLPRGMSDMEDDSQPGIPVWQAAANQGPIVMDDLIHPREKIYGTISIILGIIGYGLSALFVFGLFLAPLFVLGAFISSGMHMGAVKGRGIKVTEKQFPEVHAMVDEYSRRLNIGTPQVYVICNDGLLNAWAARYHRKDYMIICSDVLEIAYEKGEKELAFVVCHELAHIKRGHPKWGWLHAPSNLIPFFGDAYSRACEYTCDRVAQALVPDGALFGLVALAAGTKMYKHINLQELYEQSERDWDFWTWFAEIQSSHPNLVNRIRGLGIRDQEARIALGGNGRW